MALKLYELLGDHDRRFSPYCWRIRMALAHKELEAEIIPCKFTDKALFAFSGQDRVPVLQDGETASADSWDIACYLEELHAERESHRPAIEAAMAPLRAVLAQQPYICGDAPAFADYIVFGMFQWVRIISLLRLVEPGDAVYDWRARMLDLHDGLGRSVTAYPE